MAPKLRFKTEAEDKASAALIRLKVEVNTREREAYDTPLIVPFKVENPWFSGSAEIVTFSVEEVLATKLRALLQRDKGRDLIDLAHALDVLEQLDPEKTVTLFGRYLAATGLSISRAQAEQRMFAKLDKPGFLADVRPLLAAEQASKYNDDAGRRAFLRVFDAFIRKLPGDPWAKTTEMLENLTDRKQ